MSKVLITGGAGFIGKQVAQVLLAHGFEVRIYDLQPTEHVDSIQGDILDYAQLETAAQGCDAIVHLAAQISVPLSIENPKETLNINVNGTQNVFDSAKEMGVKRIILASSAAVYGNATDLPLQENILGTIQSPYASSKLKNEQQVIQARRNGIEAVALRFFNVYGPKQSIQGSYAAVIPKVIDKIKTGQKPVIFGNGTQTRDFIHVHDVAMAILKLVEIDWKMVKSSVYNIATQHQTSLIDLIEIVNSNCLDIGILQRPVQPVFEKARAGDILHSVASIERIVKEINWRPVIGFEQGIRALLQQNEVDE
tara:strand:+ start:1639 stop:2565 length:927 start_codon:yes stop_codon:yes gene_type:complete